jgi:hypothetical protein
MEDTQMKHLFRTLALVATLAMLAVPGFAQTGGISEANLNPDLDLLVNDGVPVRNATGGTLTKGTLVYICGYTETATGIVRRPKVCKADADTAAYMAKFILPRDLATATNGEAVKFLRLTAVNTLGSTVGNPAYLSQTAGGWTLTGPSAPAIAQIVGRVAVVSASVGEIAFDLRIENPPFVSTALGAGSVAPTSLGMSVRAGTNLAAGDLVYLSSYNFADGMYIASLADADVAGAQATYVAGGVIASGSTGTVYRSFLATFTTTTSTVGNPVYLTITGTTTNTMSLAAPTGGDDRVQIIGRVTVVGDATDGRVLVDTSAFVSGVATNEYQDASITRAKLATESLASFGIPISRVLQVTGIPLVAAETAGTFNVSVAANVHLAQGEITDNESETSVALFQFVLPPEYVAAGAVTIRLPCALIKTGAAVNNASTIDVAVFEQASGAVGADLSTTTAAATFAAVDTWYNKDFVITPTDLVAGDIINVVVTSVIVDSEAGGGTLRLNLSPPRVLVDIKG